MLEKSYANDGKSSSGQEEHPSSYSHLPAPFLVDEDEVLLSHLLSQQQLFVCGSISQLAQTDQNSAAASNKAIDTKDDEQIPWKRGFPKKKSNGGAKQTDPRKRSGKKDRHSKICTAQGPRDRRMRLSLQIARKFFDLQDMLGFDKASKTIEWLFSKSKTAIKELTENISQVKRISCSTTEDGGKSVSVTSDSEVVSQNVEGEFFNCITKEKANRKLHVVARDSRDKARARARERTREKLIIRGLDQVSKQISHECANPNNLGQLWSSSALETDEESCFRIHEMKSSLKMVAQVEEPTNHSLQHQINGKLLGIVGAPTSSLTFNSQDDFPGFPENWDNNNVNMQSFCCRTASRKPSEGSAIPTLTSKPQVKPCSIFTTTNNAQERILNSIFMTTQSAQEQNSSSIFFTSLINPQQQNPSSNILDISNNSLHSYFLEDQFS
jgi:hypothetical protein